MIAVIKSIFFPSLSGEIDDKKSERISGGNQLQHSWKKCEIADAAIKNFIYKPYGITATS